VRQSVHNLMQFPFVRDAVVGWREQSDKIPHIDTVILRSSSISILSSCHLVDRMTRSLWCVLSPVLKAPGFSA